MRRNDITINDKDPIFMILVLIDEIPIIKSVVTKKDFWISLRLLKNFMIKSYKF